MRDFWRVRKHIVKPASLFVALFVAIATFGITTTAQAREDFQAYWDNGIRLKSDNVSVKFGGRVQFDTGWGWGDSDFETFLTPIATGTPGPFIDGMEFRRLRLYNSGEINGKIGWKVQVDFAGGGVAIKDAYVQIKDVFAGTDITFGNQKEPFSLEELTSSKYITFMERSAVNNFAPGRSLGIAIANHKQLDGKLSAALGLFRPGEGEGGVNGPGATEDGEYSFTARLALAPILEDKGEKVVHVGFGYRFHEDPFRNNTDEFRFRARPGTHLANTRYVNTGDFDADSIQMIDFELAGQFGIVSLQGEYLLAFVSNDANGAGTNGTMKPMFWSYYIQASVFATGEFRPYKGGSFGRVKPNNEFGKGGFGAVEIAFRLDHINLTDSAEGVNGGNQTTYTLGVNWYLTPNARIMTNYVIATFDELGPAVMAAYAPSAVPAGFDEGHLQVLQSRFQVDF